LVGICSFRPQNDCQPRAAEIITVTSLVAAEIGIAGEATRDLAKIYANLKNCPTKLAGSCPILTGGNLGLAIALIAHPCNLQRELVNTW
jgi:hypothetical protein